MTYSVDVRKKVVAFVRNGGGQAEAARHFDISLWCVRDWLARQDLQPQQKGVPHQRKWIKRPCGRRCAIIRTRCCGNARSILGWDRQHGMGLAADEVDAQQKTLKYTERDPENRMAYLQKRRNIIAQRGAHDIVYSDEAGFDPNVCRRPGWSQRGHKVYGDHSGHRRPRTSLIAARRGKEFRAPMRFSGPADADLVNDGTRHMSCKELRPDATLIWDNAAFHKKKDLEAIARDSGPHTLFLPPDSPDLSRIEPDFANLKKIRQYAPLNTSLSDIIRSYGN